MLREAGVEGVDEHKTSLRPTDGSRLCASALDSSKQGRPAQSADNLPFDARARREAAAIGASGRVTTNRLPSGPGAVHDDAAAMRRDQLAPRRARAGAPRPESSKRTRQVLRERFGKRAASAAGSMPMPLSATLRMTGSPCAAASSSIEPASGVNLLALSSRLPTTCASRSGSPSTWSGLGGRRRPSAGGAAPPPAGWPRRPRR